MHNWRVRSSASASVPAFATDPLAGGQVNVLLNPGRFNTTYTHTSLGAVYEPPD